MHDDRNLRRAQSEPILAEALEPRVFLSGSDFADAISVDAEMNRKGVTVIRAGIGEADECDLFSFTARESGNQRLVLRDLNDSFLNGTLTIFDSDGEIVRQKDVFGPGEREIGQFPAERGEVFFVQVGGAEGGRTGDYRLRVKTEPGPIPDALQDSASRIDSLFDEGDGTTAVVESTIANLDHSRVYSFTARDNGSAGLILRTTAGAFDTTLDAKMIIADQAGELLRIKNKRAGGGREEARIDVVQGEQYFILVSGVWGEDVEGDFRLRVRAPAGDPPNIEIGGISVEDAMPLDIASTPQGLRLDAGAGLRMTVYDLSLDAVTQLPDFDTLTPTSRSVIDEVNFVASSGDSFGIGLLDNFGLVIEGLIDIDVATNWQFSTESDDGSRLYVDGTLVVENDGIHGMTTISGGINLEAGVHSLRLEYFESTGTSGLVLRSAGTNQVFNVVHPEVLSNGTLLHDAVGGNALYSFTAQQAGSLPLQLDSDSASNGVLAIFDVDGNLLSETDRHGRAQTESLSSTLEAGRQYFVLTSENAGTPNIEGQSLDTIPSVALSNENLGSAPVDLSQPGLVRFVASTSGAYTVSVEDGFQGRFTVYDDTGFEMTREINADADGGPDQISITLGAPGAFVVAFDAVLGDGSAGPTTLSVTGPQGEIDGISKDNAVELTHDTPFDGTISDIGQRLLFSVTADFIITTFRLETFAGLAADMNIYDEAGFLIAVVEVAEASALELILVRLTGFKFFIVIDGGLTTGDFQVTIT